MLSNLDPSSQRFLADLNRIQLRTATAQNQISSGLKVQSASDAPDQIGTLLQLESERSGNSQTLANLNRVQTEANGADNALTTAVQLLDKITQIAGQGLSSQTAQDRGKFAQQILDLQEQLVSLTSTTVEGRYIFDGGNGSGPPYQFNAAAVNGATRLSSAPATRQVQDSSGNSFQFARSAQDIFDQRDSADVPTANNIFAAISAARAALIANNPAAIATSIDVLHGASDFLGSQQTFYGTVQDRLAGALTNSQSLDVALQTQIGAIRDADLTAASLELNRGNIEQQASLAAKAKSQVKSLFDYLA